MCYCLLVYLYQVTKNITNVKPNCSTILRFFSILLIIFFDALSSSKLQAGQQIWIVQTSESEADCLNIGDFISCFNLWKNKNYMLITFSDFKDVTVGQFICFKLQRTKGICTHTFWSF